MNTRIVSLFRRHQSKITCMYLFCIYGNCLDISVFIIHYLFSVGESGWGFNFKKQGKNKQNNIHAYIQWTYQRIFNHFREKKIHRRLLAHKSRFIFHFVYIGFHSGHIVWDRVITKQGVKYGKPSHNLYIPLFSILTDPGCNLGHPIVLIMTGTTYMIANPSYQSLPSHLITSPSQVYNRRRSKCPPYYHDRVKMYNMTIDNLDPARISILTP